MVDQISGLGASQSDLADVVNRKYVGYSQRQKNEAMRSAGEMSSNQFSSTYQPQLQEANQPTELLVSGRSSDIPIVYKDNSLYSNDSSLNGIFDGLKAAGYTSLNSKRPEADYITSSGLNYYKPETLQRTLKSILPSNVYGNVSDKYTTAINSGLSSIYGDTSSGDLSGMASQGYSGPNSTAQSIGQGLGIAGALSGNPGMSSIGGMMSAANSNNPTAALSGWGASTVASLVGKGQFAGPIGMAVNSAITGQLPSTRNALVGLLSMFAPQYALPINVINTLYGMIFGNNPSTNSTLGEMGMGLNGAYGFGSGEGVAGIGGTPAGFDAGDLGFGIGGPSGFGFGGTDTAPGFSAGDLGNGISGGFGFGGDSGFGSSDSGSDSGDGGSSGGDGGDGGGGW